MYGNNCFSKITADVFRLGIVLTYAWKRQTNKLLKPELLWRCSHLLIIIYSGGFDEQRLAATYPVNSSISRESAFSFSSLHLQLVLVSFWLNK